MDDELKDLQELWQSQDSQGQDILSLIAELNAVERKSSKDKRRMLILFPLTVVVLLALIGLLPNSPLYITGISMIIAAMGMIIYLAYKNSFPPVREDQDLSNEAFLAETIQKLNGRKLMTSRYMWIYTALLVLGLNIGYVDVLKEADLTFRILGHAFVSILLPIGNYFAIKKRLQAYEKELDPLIEQLESLKQG